MDPATEAILECLKSFGSQSRGSSLLIDLLIQCLVEPLNSVRVRLNVLSEPYMIIAEKIEALGVVLLRLGKVLSRLREGSVLFRGTVDELCELFLGRLLVQFELLLEVSHIGSHFCDPFNKGFIHVIIFLASLCTIITTTALLDFSCVIEGKQAGSREGH